MSEDKKRFNEIKKKAVETCNTPLIEMLDKLEAIWIDSDDFRIVRSELFNERVRELSEKNSL